MNELDAVYAMAAAATKLATEAENLRDTVWTFRDVLEGSDTLPRSASNRQWPQPGVYSTDRANPERALTARDKHVGESVRPLIAGVDGPSSMTHRGAPPQGTVIGYAPMPGLRKPVDETTPAQAGVFVLVSGQLPLGGYGYALQLCRNGPGDVEVILMIDNKICGQIPWDNFVKAQVRLDPDHASAPDREIARLTKELAIERAKTYDQVAIVTQQCQQIVKLQERIEAFTDQALERSERDRFHDSDPP